MSSNEDDDNEDDDDQNENEDDETMSQNEKNISIKNMNDYLDEIIDKSKSFEDQIKSIKKVENLNEFYFINGYGDKEFFKTLYHHKLFKHIFGHAFETLANKLINTTNKEENQIIVNNINKNKEKHAVKLILNFNETIQLDLIWKYKNQKMSK